jgi:hypothetical protein
LPSAPGSSLRITFPWIEAPVPRRAIREAAPARRPASVAAVMRAVEIDTALMGIGRVVGHRTSGDDRPRFLCLPPILFYLGRLRIARGIRLLRRRSQTKKRFCSLLLSTAARDSRRSRPLFGAFAHRAWNPPTSSSLADEKTCLLAAPQHGGARFPTLTPLRVSDGTRTRDVLDHNQVLYQLSYTHHANGPNMFSWTTLRSVKCTGRRFGDVISSGSEPHRSVRPEHDPQFL